MLDSQQYSPYVNTLTRFIVPQSMPLFQGDTCNIHPDWLPTINHILAMPDKGRAIRKIHLGRVKENLDIVLLAVCKYALLLTCSTLYISHDQTDSVYTNLVWFSHDYFRAFKASPGYQPYWAAISRWSTPVEQVLQGSWEPVTGTGLITCWFPPLTDAQRSAIPYSTVLFRNRSANMGGTNPRSAWNRPPTRVWMLEGTREPVQACAMSRKSGHVEGNDGRPTFEALYPPLWPEGEEPTVKIDMEGSHNDELPKTWEEFHRRRVRTELELAIGNFHDTSDLAMKDPGYTERSFSDMEAYRADGGGNVMYIMFEWGLNLPDSFMAKGEKIYKEESRRQRFGYENKVHYRGQRNWPLTLLEKFDLQVKLHGCVGWREEHCDFRQIGTSMLW